MSNSLIVNSMVMQTLLFIRLGFPFYNLLTYCVLITHPFTSVLPLMLLPYILYVFVDHSLCGSLACQRIELLWGWL